MYARSTTFHGKPENVDAGIVLVERELAPMIGTIDGCRGLSLLVDRQTGRCIGTTSWDSEESMRASEDQLRPIRQRGREVFGGDLKIDEWEIAVMHRTEHGSSCRVTWVQGGSDLNMLVDLFKDSSMPSMEGLPGFCSASMLLNRSTGVACVTATYDGHESLAASRAGADEIRRQLAERAGMDVVDVREFELAYAHLHVPELV